jgi:hypothetical protein
MHPIPNECPVCRGELAVTSLHCRECDTSITGRFISGPFANLTPEQLMFVELFIKNEGKITHLEGELGLSYPTIRNRLHDIIRAMGYEPGGGAEGLSEEQRHAILEELSKGEISSEDAMRLLQDNT